MKFIATGYALGDQRVPVRSYSVIQPNWNIEAAMVKTGIDEVYRLDRKSEIDLLLDATTNADFKDFSDIDTLIYVTQSNNKRFPSLLSEYIDKTTIRKSIRIIELNQGCSGFVSAIELAYRLFESKASTLLAIVTMDAYSRYMDDNDRTTNLIFSDGAAVTVLSGDLDLSVCCTYWQSVHEDSSSLQINHKGEVESTPVLTMNGPNVFTFARTSVKKCLNTLQSNSNEIGVTVDLYLLHQASQLILDTIRTDLSLTSEQCPSYFPLYGNVTSSTIPLLISIYADLFARSKTMVLCGFGVGLHTAGITLVRNKQ